MKAQQDVKHTQEILERAPVMTKHFLFLSSGLHVFYLP